jgi:DNA invertase Pin-like site-specific DNA recombinase
MEGKMIVGYARVSTIEQSLDVQLAALREAGCERIFQEKESGAKSDRNELRKAIDALQHGDTLMVMKLDRLARSTKDLLNTLAEIADKGAKFKSLHDPWCDTTTPHGELMVTILGGLATFERHLIISRTDEGRKRAMKNGVKFGRKHVLTRHQRQEALIRRQNGESCQDIAKSYNVGYVTIWRLVAACNGSMAQN